MRLDRVVEHDPHEVELPFGMDTEPHRQANAAALRSHLAAAHGWSGKGLNPVKLVSVHAHLHEHLHELVRARAKAEDRAAREAAGELRRGPVAPVVRPETGRKAGDQPRGLKQRAGKPKNKAAAISGLYVLGATDVVHMRAKGTRVLARCGWVLRGIWWAADWQPDNYPLCKRCRSAPAARSALPRGGQITVVSGGLPGLGKRR